MPESHHRSGSRARAAAAAAVLSLAMLAGLAGLAQDAQARIVAARVRYAGAIEPLAAYQGQSSCSPTAKPGVVDLSRRLLRAFPTTRSLGIVRACSVGGQSEHKEGRAFDWGVSARSAKDRARVARFISWLTGTDKYGNRYAMARRLGIQYVIWNHKIWGTYAASAGWRRYTGANPHTDHVHISFTWAGARQRTSFWTGKVGNVKGVPSHVRPLPGNPTPLPTPAAPGQPLPAPSVTPPPPGAGGSAGTTVPPRHQPAPADVLLPGPPLVDETVRLPATSAGVMTTGALVASQPYLIEASGLWTYGARAGMVADAECSTSRTDPVWRRDRSVHPWDPTNDHLDLYVDGQDLYADPDTDTGGRCDTATHTYRYTYTPTRDGRVTFATWDPTPLEDNAGALAVRIIRSTPVDEMSWSVPASAAAGVTSPGALAAGEAYVVTVAGTVDAGGGVTSDAECSATAADPVWRRDRSLDPASPSNDHLDVLVDGRDSTFEAVSNDGAGCNVADHTYRLVLTPSETRPVNLRVNDPARGDDTGALQVRIAKAVQPSGPETVRLDTAAATGARTVRTYLAGQRLRVTASGTYTYSAAVTADAECSVTTTDRTWALSRPELIQGTQLLGDVPVSGRFFTWRPTSGATGCDAATHTYSVTFTPATTGPVTFGVADPLLADNAGTLVLTVEPAA